MSKVSKSEPRRKHDRVPVALPVQLGDQDGLTRDVSIGGIYVEMDSTVSVGNEISLEIDMATPLGPMRMHCVGRVVRTEQKGERTGIAIQMTDSRLESVRQASN